jgi:hypothetical protein
LFKPTAKARPRTSVDGTQQSSLALETQITPNTISILQDDDAVDCAPLHTTAEVLPPSQSQTSSVYQSPTDISSKRSSLEEQEATSGNHTSLGALYYGPSVESGRISPRTQSYSSRVSTAVIPTAPLNEPIQSSDTVGSYHSVTHPSTEEGTSELQESVPLQQVISSRSHTLATVASSSRDMEFQPSDSASRASDVLLSTTFEVPSQQIPQQLNFSAMVERAARTADAAAAISRVPSNLNFVPGISKLPNPVEPSNIERPAFDSAGIPTQDDTLQSEDSSQNANREESVRSGGQTSTRKRRRTNKANAGSQPLSEVPNADLRSSKKPRRRVSSSRHNQEGSPSISFDTSAQRGEDLDPTVVTMADICEDTGQGRISSKAAMIFENHAAWKRTSRERRATMRAIMEAKKYGRNDDSDTREPLIQPGNQAGDVDASASAVSTSPLTPQPVIGNEGEASDGEGDEENFDYSKIISGSRFAAQVRIGANGETIIDESSLYVDRAEEHETENYTHVEESDATKFTNSATYSRRYHGSRWSGEETELFYEVIITLIECYND